MNYFEIFNKVLLELNNRPVQDFNLIYKSEHKKILNAINRVNCEVLSSFEWPFLLRRKILDVPASEKACKLPFKGKIKSVFEVFDGKSRLNEKLSFVPSPETLLMGHFPGNFYSIFNDMIIFPKSNKDRVFDIFYYSMDYAAGVDGEFKEMLSLSDDFSIIPMPYAELILVYGASLKVKANPSHPKFGFWNTMYIQALANLRQKCTQTVESEPNLRIC